MADDKKKKKGSQKDSFDIPKYVQKKYPDLIDMVLETKSMDDKERQYWFHILPIMSDKQVDKLRAILTREKAKLAQLDEKYSKKLKDAGQEKVNFWEEQKLKDRFEEIQTKEKTAEEQEQEAEAKLLKDLEDM